jgi:hypothetical protein
MVEHAAPTGADADAGTNTTVDPDDRIRDELDRSREEVLRLRDLLIAKDAELGSLKGQVAHLEAGTARLLNLATRLRSLLPGFVWKALVGIRGRLRSRS